MNIIDFFNKAIINFTKDFTKKIFQITNFRNLWVSLLFVVIFIFALAIVIINTGPIINNRFGHDGFIVFDGLWRILQGQVPHVDFHFVLGPLFLYFFIPIAKFVGLTAEVFVYTNLILFVLFTLWSWAIAYPRSSFWITIVISFSVGLFFAGTYHLGHQYNAVTYANLYNRYSYAILFIILTEQFFPCIKKSPFNERVGGISSGILLASLFFIKITFFIPALISIILRITLIGYSKVWFRNFILGIIILSLLILYFIDFKFINLIQDYLLANKVRGNVLFDIRFILTKIVPHLTSIAILLASFLLMPRFKLTNQSRTISNNTLLLILIILIPCAVFLNLTNYGISDMPLLVFISILSLEYYLRFHLSIASKRLSSLLVIILLFCLVSGPLYIKNIASIRFAYKDKLININSINKFNSSILKNFYVRNADGYNNEDYVFKVNNGINLLKNGTNQSDRIFALNFENPFSAGLMQPSPKGGFLYWQYENNFNLNIFPDPSILFKDVTIIIIPKIVDPESTTPLINIYWAYINNHFYIKAESIYWILFSKK